MTYSTLTRKLTKYSIYVAATTYIEGDFRYEVRKKVTKFDSFFCD